MTAVDSATTVSCIFLLKAADPDHYVQAPPNKENGGFDSNTPVNVIVSGGPPGEFPQANNSVAQQELTFDGVMKDVTPGTH